MATATAKRGRGSAAKEPAKPPKKKRARAKNGQGKAPKVQASLLATVKEHDPNITSEQFALKFNLPADEVARHRAYVLQYVKDYNAKAAALRCGYPEETACETGLRMLNYAFSQLFLSEFQAAITADAVVTEGQLESMLWKEANRDDIVVNGCAMSNSSTRINAAKLLMQRKGMLAPKTKEVATTVRHVMYIAEPALRNISDVDEWGNVARGSQKRLKESTVVDV